MNQGETTDAEVQRAEPQDAMRDAEYRKMEAWQRQHLHPIAMVAPKDVWDAAWQAAQQASTNALPVPNETDIEQMFERFEDKSVSDWASASQGYRAAIYALLDWQRAQQVQP